MIDISTIDDDVERIEYINNIGNLIRDGEIPPETLNEALANSFAIQRYLNGLSETILAEDDDLKLDYSIWYAEVSKLAENKLSEGMPSSKTISDNKIKNQVIIDNTSEYKEWQNKLILSNRRVSFYSSLKDAWKTYTKHITELSQNMRTELITLRVEDRANKDLQKEKLIRNVPTENEDESDENSNEDIEPEVNYEMQSLGDEIEAEVNAMI